MKIPKISEQEGLLEYSNRLSELYATTHDSKMGKIKGASFHSRKGEHIHGKSI